MYIPNETNGPAIAIENVFAPSVVSPPCARRSAWNKSTIIPSKDIIDGPKRIAPSPVPVGCEQLPVTEGILSDERMKTKAPASARSIFVLLFFFACFCILIPGDPEDIGYIFFDIAAGLACGVGLYGYGALFVLLLCLFMIVISKIKFGKPNTTAKNLKITIPENLDYEGIFDEIIKKYSKDYTLQKVRTTDLGSLYELTYSVNMNKDADEKKFIDELRCRNGNLNIVLSLAATEFYGK